MIAAETPGINGLVPFLSASFVLLLFRVERGLRTDGDLKAALPDHEMPLLDLVSQEPLALVAERHQGHVNAFTVAATATVARMQLPAEASTEVAIRIAMDAMYAALAEFNAAAAGQTIWGDE